MPLVGIHHINIACREADIPAIERFYCAGLGLANGYRPDFPTGGVWLYCGDHPLVHVGTRLPPGWTPDDKVKSSYDHIAFDVTDAAGFQQRLDRLGIPYEAQNVPNAGYQLFLIDPMGNKVELNFPNAEAPDAVAAGTLAKIQFPDHVR